MDLKKPLLDVVKTSVQVKINLVGLADGLVDEVLEPALKEVVANTQNTFDDAAMAMVYPTLEVELKKLYKTKLEAIQKQIDEQLAKVLGQ
jgi:NH3-dependent NAD+ synthetase